MRSSLSAFWRRIRELRSSLRVIAAGAGLKNTTGRWTTGALWRGQHTLEVCNKTSGAMAAMEHNVDQKMTDQGTKLVAPVATLGAKVDEMSGDIRSVQAAVAGLVRQMNDMDAKITDISSAVR